MTEINNTVGSMLDRFRSGLSSRYDEQESKAITRSVFRETFGWDMLQLEDRRNDELRVEDVEMLSSVLGRLRAGEPLQYILGHTWFMGLKLRTGPGVLVPRPETEEMVDRITRTGMDFKRIVDVGTGSGCIAIALKKAFPEAVVHGLDVSPAALRIAQQNGNTHEAMIEWSELDIRERDLPLECDLVVSNPPYIPRSEEVLLEPHVRAHEPHVALFVENDDPLLFYKVISSKAKETLIRGGQLWFECHFQYAKEVLELVSSDGYSSAELLHDLSGHPRFIQAIR